MMMTKQEFLVTSGLHVQTLELWIEQRWIIPVQTTDEVQFSDIDVARVRFIQELRHDLGANDAGIDVILHLMDQLHGVRRVLMQLRRDVQERPSDEP
jgi:chaperone modulatory protein CbpM